MCTPYVSGFSRFIALSCLIALCARGADAASVDGRVTDPDGASVPNVRVVASTALGTAADRVTDRQGRFDIDGLPAGRYSILVAAEGFQADPVSIVLQGDETRTVDFHLRVSAITESVVVSAEQVGVPLSQVADSVTILTAADLQASQVETVADALRLVPGLTVTRSGGRGALTSIFPRGGESDFTLVLVDGMRANSFGGGFDFGHLSLGDIDRIEVVPSPQSALYGSDAIGGVIQIVTRRGGPSHVDGLIEGGSDATARTVVSGSGTSGAWTFGGGAEYRRSNGFTGIAPGTGQVVSNDDDHAADARGTIGWQEPGGASFVVDAHIGHDERGFPGPYGSDPIGAYAGIDRVSRGTNDTRQVGFQLVHPWSRTVHQRIDASFTDLAGTFVSPYDVSTSGTVRVDVRVQEDVALAPSLGASAGVQVTRERATSTYITDAAGAGIPIRRGIVGTFGEMRFTSGERLAVTAGVRAEHITRDAVPADPSGYPPRPAFSDQTVTSINPKIAASYLLTPPDRKDATRVRASAGTGIRPPDAFEIAYTDNAGLKPERSRSADVGIEQQLGSGAYVVGATAFFNQYNDLIVTTGRALAGASRYYSDNISNARSRGLELTGSARIGSALAIRANYTFMDTRILAVDSLSIAPPPFTVGDPLIRRPRHQGLVEATYSYGRGSAFAQLSARGRVLDVEPNYGASGGLFPAPGYAVVTVGASVHVSHDLELYGRVMNLFDRPYEETLGYPALGRNGIIGVRVAAGR
jgi:vitamin B12 transporter